MLRRHVARSASTRSSSARTRRFRRCSCASRTSIRPAAAPTATRAPTPTRSAGRRRAQPLPMIRDPRVVFDQLFGVGATPQRARRAARGGSQHPRLAAARRSRGCRRRSAPADRARLGDYLDDVREIERRIQKRRGVQPQRRAARAARRADRRARLVLRARQADVRPAGARVRVRHHARLRVQAGPRRVEPHLSRKRLQRRVPLRVASRRARGPDPRLREDQHATTSA